MRLVMALTDAFGDDSGEGRFLLLSLSLPAGQNEARAN